MQTLFNGCQDKSMKSKNQEAKMPRTKEIPKYKSQLSSVSGYA
jgi:hypothetical protein